MPSPLPPIFALRDATIFTGEAMVDGHALVVKDGVILDIVANNKIPTGIPAESHGDCILAPGFIDAQVNGGGNVLLNNTPTAEACIAIAKAHEKFGTARILPTVITDQPDITAKAITAMREARRSCKNILGIHIEGPHLGQERRGVHKSAFIRALTAEDMNLYRREGDEIILVTVAPENVTPEQINQLVRQGVIVSIGHTNASREQVMTALKAGATGFTHLFNGMGGLSARGDSPASVALDDRDSWCGIIADGHHVSDEMMRLAIRAKPEKIFLVSDAMPPAASEIPQPFKLYGETITLDKDRCINSEGKLAGAAITMADAVRHCVKIGVGLEEALRMASLYPAAFLGLDKKFGKLLPRFEATIMRVNQNLDVQAIA